MHNRVTSHFGSSPPCTRHPIHACAPVCCVVVDFSSTVSVLYFVPPLSFQPFQMFSSVFTEKFRSNPLCDFRLGTVATSDHETPLTKSELGSEVAQRPDGEVVQQSKSSQSSQPNPNPDHDRTEKPVVCPQRGARECPFPGDRNTFFS